MISHSTGRIVEEKIILPYLRKNFPNPLYFDSTNLNSCPNFTEESELMEARIKSILESKHKQLEIATEIVSIQILGNINEPEPKKKSFLSSLKDQVGKEKEKNDENSSYLEFNEPIQFNRPMKKNNYFQPTVGIKYTSCNRDLEENLLKEINIETINSNINELKMETSKNISEDSRSDEDINTKNIDIPIKRSNSMNEDLFNSSLKEEEKKDIELKNVLPKKNLTKNALAIDKETKTKYEKLIQRKISLDNLPISRSPSDPKNVKSATQRIKQLKMEEKQQFIEFDLRIKIKNPNNNTKSEVLIEKKKPENKNHTVKKNQIKELKNMSLENVNIIKLEDRSNTLQQRGNQIYTIKNEKRVFDLEEIRDKLNNGNFIYLGRNSKNKIINENKEKKEEKVDNTAKSPSPAHEESSSDEDDQSKREETKKSIIETEEEKVHKNSFDEKMNRLNEFEDNLKKEKIEEEVEKDEKEDKEKQFVWENKESCNTSNNTSKLNGSHNNEHSNFNLKNQAEENNKEKNKVLRNVTFRSSCNKENNFSNSSKFKKQSPRRVVKSLSNNRVKQILLEKNIGDLDLDKTPFNVDDRDRNDVMGEFTARKRTKLSIKELLDKLESSSNFQRIKNHIIKLEPKLKSQRNSINCNSHKESREDMENLEPMNSTSRHKKGYSSFKELKEQLDNLNTNMRKKQSTNRPSSKKLFSSFEKQLDSLLGNTKISHKKNTSDIKLAKNFKEHMLIKKDDSFDNLLNKKGNPRKKSETKSFKDHSSKDSSIKPPQLNINKTNVSKKFENIFPANNLFKTNYDKEVGFLNPKNKQIKKFYDFIEFSNN